jgi:hypothetical protein
MKYYMSKQRKRQAHQIGVDDVVLQAFDNTSTIVIDGSVVQFSSFVEVVHGGYICEVGDQWCYCPQEYFENYWVV